MIRVIVREKEYGRIVREHKFATNKQAMDFAKDKLLSAKNDNIRVHIEIDNDIA